MSERDMIEAIVAIMWPPEKTGKSYSHEEWGTEMRDRAERVVALFTAPPSPSPGRLAVAKRQPGSHPMTDEANPETK